MEFNLINDHKMSEADDSNIKTPTPASTPSLKEPKLCKTSQAPEVVAFFADRWTEEGVLEEENNIFAPALITLGRISGKCFTNIIVIFNSFLGRDLFAFTSKALLRHFLRETVEISSPLVAHKITEAVFEEAGLYF